MHAYYPRQIMAMTFLFRVFEFQDLLYMCSKKIVEGMPPIELQEKVCEGSTHDKHYRNSFLVGRSWRASHILELVYSDLCGPMHTTLIGGNWYFLTFIDDYSRKT